MCTNNQAIESFEAYSKRKEVIDDIIRQEEFLNDVWALVADRIELDTNVATAGTDEDLLEGMSMKELNQKLVELRHMISKA